MQRRADSAVNEQSGYATPFLSGTVLKREELARLIPEKLADILLGLIERHPDLMQEVAEAFKRASKSSPATEAPDDGLMIGACDAMRTVFDSIRRFAQVDAPILITGESGTGKELAAKAVHERSAFSRGPFVAVNCGGLPETLVASELFGYERGSFTGATERRIGRIEAANRGTLFLDEIGDMPMSLQPQLLRFLQDMTIQRIGGKDIIPVHLRVIAATNVDLEQAVQDERFRKDLFFRLNVLRLDLPPLRERNGDIPVAAQFFLRRVCNEHGLPVPKLTAAALALLESYDWPGNLRELISAVRRAAIMCDEDRLDASEFAFLNEMAITNLSNQDTPDDARSARPRKPTPEELLDVLAKNGNNVSRTARYFGVSRVTLYNWLKKAG